MLSKTALRRAAPAARRPLAAYPSLSLSAGPVQPLQPPQAPFSSVARQCTATPAHTLAGRPSLRAMPLRAKIRPPRPAPAVSHSVTRSVSTAADTSSRLWTPVPDDAPEDVLFTSHFGLRTIELNRPGKYNSLDGSMIRKMAPRLLEWERSDMANIVLIKGAGDKAFCAGGDVDALAKLNKTGAEGKKASADYFALEYKLDHLLATYAKPVVALMDGITMGGGVGLSVHAPFRIATERTLFAMPETNIGFFPDVGASFFLPRLPGAVGTYLALTSERLAGPNVFYAGLATHYLHSTSLPALEARLAELRFHDYDAYDKRIEMINATIEEFTTGLPHDQPIALAGNLRRAIDRVFSLNSVSAIVGALHAEAAAPADTPHADDQTRAWAAKTLATLERRSPTAVHVALRQMRIGGAWSIAETFRREHLIAARFMQHPDFTEGVSKLLVEKSTERPSWQPATLADIAARDGPDPSYDITEPFFTSYRDPAVDPEDLALLNDRDYTEYPYLAAANTTTRIGVPTEKDVFEVVSQGDKTPREVVNQLVGVYRGKQGVQEVVQEIVDRKTIVTPRGNVEWVY